MKVLYSAVFIGLLVLTSCAVHRMHRPAAHHPAGWVDPTYCPPDPRECD